MPNTVSYTRSDGMDAGQYYRVAQAARVLQVSPSTVWRWIEAKRLVAYRVGPKAIRIKKRDLDAVVSPVSPASVRRKGVSEMKEHERGTVSNRPRQVTDEEATRGLMALTRLRALREAHAARHRGQHFPASEDLLRQERTERATRL